MLWFTQVLPQATDVTAIAASTAICNRDLQVRSAMVICNRDLKLRIATGNCNRELQL
jgi:hypothetical protein